MILLDSHVLIWWANGDRLRLSATALAAIDGAIENADQPGGSPGLLVSAISCWEVAMLVNRGRLALSLDVERWLALLASHPAVRLLPLDPADRFLEAQARELGIPLRSLWRGRRCRRRQRCSCGVMPRMTLRFLTLFARRQDGTKARKILPNTSCRHR